MKEKTQHLFKIALLLVCAAAVFLYAGVQFLPDAATSFRRVKVNDDYNTNTAPVDIFRQTIVYAGRLEGVRLLLTDLSPSREGSLSVSLLDPAGKEIAASSLALEDATEGFFETFLFAEPVFAEENTKGTLVITAETIGSVSLKKSEDAPVPIPDENGIIPYHLSSFRLIENGTPQNGVLALHYVTRYAGDFLRTPFLVFSLSSCVFLVLLYLSFFVLKLPLDRVFVFSALYLGLLFLLIIPFRTAPDEYVHISTVYRMSNTLFGISDPAGELIMRLSDAMYLRRYDFDATDIFAYQDLAEQLFSRASLPGATTVVPVATPSTVLPLMYLPQLLGVFSARLIGIGKFGLLFFGRLANLLFYTLTVATAIRRTPFAKPLFFAAGLLPMSLQIAASFCYDTYVIAFAFLFVALVLEASRATETLALKSLLPVLLTGLLLAPAKAVYLPITLCFLFIRTTSFRSVREARRVRALFFVSALALWMAWNAWSILPTIGAAMPSFLADPISYVRQSDVRELLPVYLGTESIAIPEPTFSIRYILSHPKQTLLLIANSLLQDTPLWLQGLIGGRLGEIIVIKIEINWLAVIGLFLLLLLAALPDDRDHIILDQGRRRASFFIALSCSLLFVLACISWTPISYQTIFGVQGRYFLPVLPLFLLSLRGDLLTFRRPAAPQILFSGACLTLFTALQAFLIIIGR